MSGKVGDNPYRASGVVATVEVEAYDDNQIQSNIAVLGFYIAVNGSLVRYNLVDQSIDEYFDTTGVDAGNSTNELRSLVSPYYYYGGTGATITEDADATGEDGLYTWYKWTDSGATGSFITSITQDVEYLIVAGGGSGGTNHGGAGGAGGYLAATGLELTGGNTYTVTVGAGGAANSGGTTQGATGGDSILSGTGISTLTSGGGGGGGKYNTNGSTGGSGGGGGSISGAPGGGSGGAATGVGTGYAGTTSCGDAAPEFGAGGGGGAGAVGPSCSGGGSDGGIGIENDIIETGTDVWYAGGGGGGSKVTASTAGNVGAGSNGRTEGGGGRGNSTDAAVDTDATANTGGGGGGTNTQDSGAGGTGIVVLRRLTAAGAGIADLTLQSTDVTALSAPDYSEIVMLIENAYGTATLNTDIKAYVSRDSGTTFTQGTLVDEGTWGTNKKILGFHDLDISGQPSSTAMCYKITTHNQVATSLETRIYGTSIGWR